MSAETPVQKNLVEANGAYASNFPHGDLALPPAKKYLILTCMDARIDPAAALGISLGDAHVVRNAGASAREALRSIVISQQLLGTREVFVIKHTDCGMLTFTGDVARGIVGTNLGAEAAAEVAGLDFEFPHLEDEVKKDVEWLRGRKADDDLTSRSRTSILHLIGTVHADQALRDASLEADKLLSAAGTESIARRDIAALVRAVYERYERGEEDLDPEDAHLLEQTYGAYRRNGSALEEGPERDRFLALKRELQDVLNAARKTLNEADDGVWFTRAELEGVPDRNIAKYKRGDEDGGGSETYRVTFRGGDYPALMQNAVRAATRKRAYLARNNRFPENVERLRRVVKLRDTLAKILCYENHASLKMESRMSESVDEVVRFLEDLRVRLTPLGKEEIAAVLRLKRAHLEEGAADAVDEEELGTLYEWDWAFYVRMYDREKFALDMSRFPEYFEVWHTLAGMLSIFERLFKLSFRRAECDGWHEDVILYTVWDGDELGAGFLGYLYLDIFNRKGKLSQARHVSIVPGFIDEGRGKRQYRASALILSLSKPTVETPTLLLHGEVKTMFHELGHAIHYLVSKTKYALGFSRDFVEIPSIMLENWIWDPNVLVQVSKHYSLLGEDTARHWKAEQDKAVAGGVPVNGTQHMLGLVHQALFDLTIHTGKGYGDVADIDLTRLYSEMGRDITMLAGLLDGRTGEPTTIKEAGFGHIFRAYDAGYFAYAMARTIAMDLFVTFFAKDPMDAEVGARYRRDFLQRGAGRPEAEILRGFLGRKPSTVPFFEFLAGAPKPLDAEPQAQTEPRSRLA
ncbi:unnamed protein product [Parascedosporium putredinis]|uniref:Peptidase M3A/M3B catalytic domain-containing protein n=1 Tax=Parascedosporium putredinis TaxID=1442378 RepID=A0A9P1HAB8_9PEZI|nr:unnamed protein product [Parascedosporium putredinis]CAI8003889.1 unnamed protein product [Parascedosporium putredinis]